MNDMNKDDQNNSGWDNEDSKWDFIAQAITWSVLFICAAAVLITGMLTGVIS